MKRGAEDAFARRFHRGHTADTVVENTNPPGEFYVDRICGACGNSTMNYPSVPNPLCFTCSNKDNIFAWKGIRFSMEDTGAPSSNADRIKAGTQNLNLGLPPAEVTYGAKNAYGQRKVLKSRPYSTNEVASSHRYRETAKRAGLTPQETPKRAIGK